MHQDWEQNETTQYPEGGQVKMGGGSIVLQDQNT